MRKAVGSQCLQPPRQTPLKLELERMVVRRRRAGGERYAWKICGQVTQLSHPKQIASDRADVRHGKALPGSDGLFERGVPLVTPRKLEARVGDDKIGRGKVG